MISEIPADELKFAPTMLAESLEVRWRKIRIQRERSV